MTFSCVSAPAHSAPLSVVAVVGSNTHRPSKTAVLIEAILDEPATTGNTIPAGL